MEKSAVEQKEQELKDEDEEDEVRGMWQVTCSEEV